MADEYIPKSPRYLTTEQLNLKKRWDAEFKSASDALSNPFYQKKREKGVTAEEEVDYTKASSALWAAEKQRRIDASMYRIVTPQDKLARIDSNLAALVMESNEIRAELGLKAIKVF